jgi:phosphoenolpyruvate carboxykinase (GTP)
MGDYLAHWLEIGETGDASKLPKLFWVNWFRKGENGKFLWPGFGENSRVLKFVLERVEGEAPVIDTPIGRVPPPEGIETDGLDLDPAVLEELLTIDPDRWREELPQLEEHYTKLGERLPRALRDQLASLEKRLAN